MNETGPHYVLLELDYDLDEISEHLKEMLVNVLYHAGCRIVNVPDEVLRKLGSMPDEVLKELDGERL